MPPSGYRALALSGTEYARRVLRGEAAILEVPIGSFVADLAMALRPHFFALSSVAALAGASAVSSVLSPGILLAAGIGGLGWGVGQLLNDLLDRDADSVNAPDRAIAAGRLPAGPTLVIAALLGVVLAVGTALVHPLAWLLAIAASLMIVVYNAAKRWPLLGNLAHGALMATAAAIGASAALPRGTDPASYFEALYGAWRTFLFVGAIAAWYLQSNYEKDRPGDRAAGYLTLAAILSVRGSAILRAVAIVGIGLAARASGTLPDPISLSTMAAGVVVGAVSTIEPIAKSTDEAALRGYRAAVPASILAMLALAAPLLGRWGTTATLVVALALVAAAFRRSSNP